MPVDCNIKGNDMNNDQLKDLLIESGFVLWDEESGRPGGAVDWACDYDQEIRKLIELVATKCANLCCNSSFADSDAHAHNILYEFNVDNCRDDK